MNDYTIAIIGTIGNPYYDNIDVFVYFPRHRQKYVSTFYTVANVIGLMEKDKNENEHLSGLYYHDRSWLLIRELTPQTICDTVAHLLETGAFRYVFEGPTDYDEGLLERIPQNSIIFPLYKAASPQSDL